MLIFISSLIIILPVNYFYSNKIRSKITKNFKKILKNIESDTFSNELDESTVYDFERDIMNLEKALYAILKKNSSFKETYENLVYVYELTTQHNTLLIEVISFMDDFFKEDFSRVDIERKIRDLEKDEGYEKIDKELYKIIKNNMIKFFEKIDTLKKER